MRWYLCVCLLALFSLDEVICARKKNSFSLEKDEEHEPVRNTMDINNPDEEYDGGSGAISIEGSGSPPPIVTGSGEQEILVLDIRVTGINGVAARFTDELMDNESPYFVKTQEFICTGILTIVMGESDMDCRVLEFTEGSIIAKTELTILPSSSITPEDVGTQIKKAAKLGSVGALTVDPKSVVVKSPYTGVRMTSTDAPGVVTRGMRPDVNTPTMKVKAITTNEFVFETQETTSQKIVDVKPTKISEDTFFEKLSQNPVMIAGMVGAAVLVLLTMILLSMFIVYRVKKKDEGSYSLDEPNKKDPQAYWKDTKEFYA